MRRAVSIAVACLIPLTAVVAAPREPQRGYRGFFDWDNSFGKTEYFSCATGHEIRDFQWLMGLISTSHGYQFNNHFYLGAGFMIGVATPALQISLPIFADFRYDYSYKRFTPFGDLRIGWSLGDGNSIYLSPTVGYRLNWGRKVNLNFGAGMTILGKTEDKYSVGSDISFEPDEYYVYYSGKKHTADFYFTFRISIDF